MHLFNHIHYRKHKSKTAVQQNGLDAV